ncbi:hypothetical protein CQ10_00855 [Bradyrhizobium valentinum]|nr:hypothetical protein CQ10_00855 [Bradyrhizobium valentinum]
MPVAHDMIGLYFAVGSANHLPPLGRPRRAAVDQSDRGGHSGQRRKADRARYALLRGLDQVADDLGISRLAS